MTTLTKILAGAVLALFFTSCQFDINFGEGVKGNGNVESETRTVSADFTEIKATEGLDVYVTQESEFSIRVEADENVIDLIRTDIKDNMLHIHAEENIGRCKSKKIYVSLPTVTKLHTTSGADLFGQNTIKADDIELKSTSGSDIKVSVNANQVDCDTSSGADIRVSGTANALYADASSGSDIKAGDLEVKKCVASASSGADITVNTSESLTAEASSGADIKYKGNPENVSKNKSASGSVHKY